MIPKAISSIERPDIDALIMAPRIEDRQIDYKLQLPGNSDDDKREFLADVVSFANAAGGDLLFGVDEANGVPTAALGVQISNFDELRLKMQSLIRDAVDPRIPSVEIAPVNGFQNGPVVVVRVHQSWQSPHMVTFKGWSKFFVRDPGQRHQMDVQELRLAFLGGEAAAERVREFRDERADIILSQRQPPVPLYLYPTIVIHVLPVGPAFGAMNIDPRTAHQHAQLLTVSEFVYTPNDHFNLEGLLLYSPTGQNGVTDSYVQVFRDGGIEAVATFVAIGRPADAIYGGQVEKQVIRLVDATGSFRRAMNLEVPVVVAITLIRVRGVPLMSSGSTLVKRFDRDVVKLPEAILHEFAAVPKALRLIFDTMWQAAGWKGSPYFDQSGNWSPPS